jgi:hypothetical protein
MHALAAMRAELGMGAKVLRQTMERIAQGELESLRAAAVVIDQRATAITAQASMETQVASRGVVGSRRALPCTD